MLVLLSFLKPIISSGSVCAYLENGQCMLVGSIDLY